MSKLKFIFLFVTGLLVLTACGARSTSLPTQEDLSPAYTAAAQTIVAQLTQAAGNLQPTIGPANLSTATQAAPQPSATQQATATLAPTQTLAPTSTLAPTPTSTPQPTAAPQQPTSTPINNCYKAAFVKDLNYPDKTKVTVGTTIYKTWRLKNIGTCTWNDNFSLVFSGGVTMGSPKTLDWTFGNVPANHTVDITIAFKVPDKTGTYTSEWEIESSKGDVFGVTGDNGVDPFFVKIVAIAREVHFDFVAKGPKAVWRNATTVLIWNNRKQDFRKLGQAGVRDGLLLEDGLTYDNALITYPERIFDGMISGLYPGYTVQDGDHFHADVGFRDICSDNTRAKFQLSFVYDNTVYLLKEWRKGCNGELKSLDVDLTGLKGKNVQFLLAVLTDGAWGADYGVWINPRVD